MSRKYKFKNSEGLYSNNLVVWSGLLLGYAVLFAKKLEPAEGQLVAVTINENGEAIEKPLNISAEEAKNKMITNSNGDALVVNSKGEAMGATEFQETGGGNTRLMKNYNKEKESKELTPSTMVTFSSHPTQNYGFDRYTEQKSLIQKNYPVLENGHRPAFKSVESFKYDKVAISSTEGIKFRDEMGIPSAAVDGGISLSGASHGSTKALYAYREKEDKTEEIVGKLSVVSFDNEPKRVHIIPVNDAKLPSASELEATLTHIYKQAVATWTVLPEEKVSVDFPNGIMTHEGSGTFSTYNKDQNAIANAYEASNRKFEPGDIYLFFVKEATFKERSLAGFMPLQRQIGFIYGSPSLEVVAHELAHGTFNLRHTFSPEAFIEAERKTQNLMDYAGGTELWKHQWDAVHNPERVMFAWGQDESEGAMMDLSMSKESIKKVVNLIRKCNIAKGKTADLSIFSLSKGGCANLKLTDSFTLEYVDVSIESGKYIENQDNPFLFEPLTIKPMELKSTKITNPPLQAEDFIQISFNRFDQAAPPRMGIVESDSVGIYFTVKLAQKDEFEAYLKNELYAKAIWISQFDENFFRNCTCFPLNACCFYASQQIVKNSTKLYSPNGNQIATMRFPISDAPLISMQTPVSIPSGFKSGVAYLDASLAEGKPIVVGVYYSGRQELQQRRTVEAQERLNAAQEDLNVLIEEIEMIGETEALLRQREVLEGRLNAAQQDYNQISQRGRINSVEPTFHYVVVVAKGYNVEQQREYYRFQEVGTGDPINGTHNGNRFYIYDDKLVGRQGFSTREYIVTEVRQHSQTGGDCSNKQ